MSLKYYSDVISFEEFLENKEKYLFDIEVISKEELGLASSPGQAKKIEKLNSRVHTRISDLEKKILEIGATKKGMSQSEFLRFLILQHGKEEVKEHMEKDYNERLEEYNEKLEELKSAKLYRWSVLDLRGATKSTANHLYKERTRMKYEIENLENDLNHLKTYLDKYKHIFK